MKSRGNYPKRALYGLIIIYISLYIQIWIFLMWIFMECLLCMLWSKLCHIEAFTMKLHLPKMGNQHGSELVSSV